MFYVFFRTNKKYDWLYFTASAVIVGHWLLANECVISYLEKYIMDNSYKYGQEPTNNPSASLYQTDPYIVFSILIVIQVLLTYNLYTLLVIYKVPLPILIAIILSLSLYQGYWRSYDILDREIKQLKKQAVPEWVTGSPYLKDIYEKKIGKPISLTDIFNRLTCFIVPSCNTNQIDWKLFEEHCEILREKTKADTYDYVVGIESGGAFVGRALRSDCKYIKISKYDDNPNILGPPVIKTVDDLSVLRDARVLVVDDQMCTGQTMATAHKYLMEVCGARHVDRAVLYSRKSNANGTVEFFGLPYVISRSPWGYSA